MKLLSALTLFLLKSTLADDQLRVNGTRELNKKMKKKNNKKNDAVTVVPLYSIDVRQVFDGSIDDPVVPMTFVGTASLRSFENGDVHVSLDTDLSRSEGSSDPSYDSVTDGFPIDGFALGNGGCSEFSFVPLPYEDPDVPQFVYGSGGDANKVTAGYVVKEGFEFDTILLYSDTTNNLRPVYGTDTVVCGDVQRRYEVLEAEISPYPGYTGGLVVEGSVKVEFLDEYVFKFEYDLKGLSKGCSECGIHIHDGMSCDDDSLVGNHMWDATVTADPWFDTMNAYYTSDKKGKAKGSFLMKDGYDFNDHQFHTVVVHDGGTKIGCGQLLFNFAVLF